MPNTICAISSSPPEAGRSPAGAGRTGRAKHAPSRRHDPPSGPILHHLPPAKPMSGRSSRAADAALGGCASGFPVVVLPFGFFPGLLLVLAKFLCGIAAAAHLSPQPAAPATVGLGKDQGYGRSGRLPPGAGFLVSFVTHTGSSHPATAANNTPCVQQRAIPGPGARCLGLSAVNTMVLPAGCQPVEGLPNAHKDRPAWYEKSSAGTTPTRALSPGFTLADRCRVIRSREADAVNSNRLAGFSNPGAGGHDRRRAWALQLYRCRQRRIHWRSW
ncbi:hypothetical protein SAMN04488693_101320 [Arthrobacter subterraneus]|uniref:Uncharacterized protein n=1 Tax=Arthrobacter subterraneus TaxID=335973 RepID=A0A1G8CMB7_9MICC|nr:hypothetical protein SAMN04488693_101320 [Arthrobacter subterraneus]